MSNSLRPHGLKHATLSCPSLSPGACSNSCPLSWWCHPAISSSVAPFSFGLQSFPASGPFPVGRLFVSGSQSIGLPWWLRGRSIGVSASVSVLPMHIQGWFPLGWTGLISLQCKGVSRVFSSITVRKHQFFASGGQSTGVSATASFLPKKSQGWSLSEWTDFL